MAAQAGRVYVWISIHASRGGSDSWFTALSSVGIYFNPRFPWGKRRSHDATKSGNIHFNPRFPWGKRQELKEAEAARYVFQSTLPVGEATQTQPGRSPSFVISIHASRGGSDANSTGSFTQFRYFNPRFPWGKRLGRVHRLPLRPSDFNPRFPWGKRPVQDSYNTLKQEISIHASRGGSDSFLSGCRH